MKADEKACLSPGERFRSERKRLNMKATEIARVCGTTETTVFNWEANRARIPLHAAERLWPYGFDPEHLVGGAVELVKVVSINGHSPFVPKHLLHRHGLTEDTAGVYHNPARAANLMPEGELCLLSLDLTLETMVVFPIIALVWYRPSNLLFLCHLVYGKKSGVELKLGAIKGKLKSDSEFAESCEVVGYYCCRLGNEQFKGIAISHEDNLKKFLKSVDQ